MTPPYGPPAGRADALVVFGVTGDLVRVMTLRSLYRLERRGLLDCPVVGVAVDPWTTGDLRKYSREAIENTGERADPQLFDRFAARLSYLSGDLNDADTYRRLAGALRGARLPVCYLALPPRLYRRVVRGLHEAGLSRTVRVLLEKPFGHDLPSAIALADELHHYLDESQVFRVDHFLGKAGFDELLQLRFGNAMLQPAWNRHHVESVQITLAEDFGVAERGHLYDEMGALRDVCANHMLEVLAAGAMDEPTSLAADAIKDQQAALWEAMPAAEPANYVRGQYDGYREVDGVAEDSTTETFAAIRLDVDNGRWSGVPFFLRTGKLLAALQTEFRLILRRTPHGGDQDQIVVRFDPSAGLRLHLTSKGSDGQPTPIVLDRELGREGVSAPTPYEVLLDAALRGDATRFDRQDGVQQRWRVMQPLLDSPPPVQPYAPGSWGPAAADRLLGPYGPWQSPWVPAEVST